MANNKFDKIRKNRNFLIIVQNDQKLAGISGAYELDHNIFSYIFAFKAIKIQES